MQPESLQKRAEQYIGINFRKCFESGALLNFIFLVFSILKCTPFHPIMLSDNCSLHEMRIIVNILNFETMIRANFFMSRTLKVADKACFHKLQ